MKHTPPSPLLLALFQATHALEERLEAAFSSVGLSGARYRVLDELARSGEPLALGEIAARHSCVRSNMTQLIDRLESEGFVRRLPDPADRRSVRAAITPLGRERHTAGSAALSAFCQEFEAAFCASDHEALSRVLARIQAMSEKIHG